MTVKLIIKRNEYGSLDYDTRSQYVFTAEDKAVIKQLSLGGSEPAALATCARLVLAFTGAGDIDAAVADIVASVDYDNMTIDRLWEISHYIHLLANKLILTALDMRDNQNSPVSP